MRKALTMGELLVTMAVIGTIATLVLPGFLKDYHNKLYVTRLKKVYETLEHAVNQACVDYSVSSFKNTPYVKNGSNPTTGKLYEQEFINKYFKMSGNQTTMPFASEYRAIGSSSKQGYGIATTGHGWGKLASGEAVSFYCNDSLDTTFCVFRVDVNSTDGPNIGGRDIFTMYIDRTTNEIYDNFPDGSEDGPDCRTTFDVQGNGCFGRLLKDNWEMKY